MDQDNKLQAFKSIVNDAVSQGDTSLQSKIQELMNSLKLMGVDTTGVITKIEERLSEDALNALNIEVFRVLDETDLQNLTNAFNTGLTEYQQRMLILELYKKKAGREIEEYAAELYEQLSRQLIQETTQYLSLMSKIKVMSDEDCDKALALIKNDNYEEAVAYVEGKSNEAAASTSSTQATQQPNEEMMLAIMDALKSKDYEKAKEILTKLSA